MNIEYLYKVLNFFKKSVSLFFRTIFRFFSKKNEEKSDEGRSLDNQQLAEKLDAIMLNEKNGEYCDKEFTVEQANQALSAENKAIKLTNEQEKEFFLELEKAIHCPLLVN